MACNKLGMESGKDQGAPPRYQEDGGVSPGAGQHPPKGAHSTVIPVGPLETPHKDYMGFSIFNMLCCCLPLGVAALTFAIATRDANLQGNYDAADRNSKMARKLNYAALGIGLTMLIGCIIYVAVFDPELE